MIATWVALKPISDILGIDSWSQQRKVTRSETIVYRHMTAHDSSGRKQEMFCINIDHIGEWIFGINPKKVKPEIRERMLVLREKKKNNKSCVDHNNRRNK